MNSKRKPVAERYWPKVDIRGPDECWPWLASLWKNGYGKLGAGGKYGGSLVAHRIAYELAYGPIPKGLEIDHLCHDPAVCKLANECPHRRCQNPTHLEAVPHRINCLRGGAPLPILGILNAAKTHCPKGHAYDLVFSDGKRYCRTCRNEQQRERYWRGKAETSQRALTLFPEEMKWTLPR